MQAAATPTPAPMYQSAPVAAPLPPFNSAPPAFQQAPQSGYQKQAAAPMFQPAPVPPMMPPNAGPMMPPNAGPPPQFVVGVGNWLGTMLLLMFVPLALLIVATVVGGYIGHEHIVTSILTILSGASSLILMLIWAFSRRTNPSKRNFFRAALILTLIMVVLTVALVLVVMNMFGDVYTEIHTNGWTDVLEQYQFI
jgi:hypothetical protein